MSKIDEFEEDKVSRIIRQGRSAHFKNLTKDFLEESIEQKYSYNFSWLGIPIIQYPQDIVAMQELIWKVKPDLIIETGVAHGGSLILYASLLELLGKGMVLGIDIDIRPHNREAIVNHELYKRIKLIEGSSIAGDVITLVKQEIQDKTKIMVVLDSNHTHEYVLKEMELYSPFVSVGSYMVVFDTVVEDLPADKVIDRPWSKGDNPKTAVWQFLSTHEEFEIDAMVQNKILITVAPDGYLRRVK